MRRRFEHSNFEQHNSAMCYQLQPLLAGGQATLYKREYTYQHLKQSGMLVARDYMFSILKEGNPAEVANRRLHLSTNPRGAYFVPGPNFVWSIDGHHKLSMYGIKIYACINEFLW